MRTPGLHDVNVSDAEYAERVDTDRSHYPTRWEAEVWDESTVMAKRVVEPCEDACAHLLCAMQRRVSEVAR